ncbi:MAG: TonB-dependent receptor plug domain-containing protein, partial [Lentisphaeraceae bacterium]|nr:TonB-dependent receptor plug domain-containing protein [Lentisphaeraceae bacterium]
MKRRILLLMAFLFATEASSQEEEIKLSLDKLFNLKVTSVSGTAMDMKKSPAAIYVITSEDFKKQGHRTLPDALRAVPGFHVRKLSSNKWSISARGDNGRFANKLLVLIDGRSVYTPLFSGVYWEIQDLPLEDIDRIEVIRGPGATLWGANAVNGVINIVTKSVRDTEGGYVKLGLGNVDSYETEYRYGWQVSDNVFAKVWGKNFDRGESELSSGLDANDSWDGGHYGTKLDWYATAVDTHSFQANFSKLNIGSEAEHLDFFGFMPDTAPVGALGGADLNSNIPIGTPLFNGQTRKSSDFTWTTGNVSWNWTKSISSSSGWKFQTYYDYTDSEDQL